MTQRTVLDTAGFIDITRDESPVVQSAPTDGIVLTHVRNGDIGNRTRRTFTLRWAPATTSMAREIHDHYAANAHQTFELQVPGGGVADAIYLQPPQFQNRTSLAADVTVVLEEALSKD